MSGCYWTVQPGLFPSNGSPGCAVRHPDLVLVLSWPALGLPVLEPRPIGPSPLGGFCLCGSPLAGELPGNCGVFRRSRAGCARCRGLSLPARGLPGILEQSKQTGWSIPALAESPSGPGWRLSVNGDYLRACGAAPSDVAASDRAGVGNPQSHREEIPGRRGSSDAATLGGPRDAII